MNLHLWIGRTHPRWTHWLGVGALLFAAAWTHLSPAQTFTNVVVPTNSTWRLFRGVTEASAPADAWRARAYDDSLWEVAPAPFHYGTNLLGGDDTVTSGTILSDMPGGYTSIFLRQKFFITNVSSVIGISMRLAIDDGFIVWLNGVEMRRGFMTAGAVAYTGTALSSHEANFSALIATAPNAWTNLVEGTNVLCVQGFNGPPQTPPLTNDDFRIDPEFWLTVAVPVVITNVTPEPGSSIAAFTTVTVAFNQPVSNVDPSDLLINGFPASLVSGAGQTYTFTFARPTGGSGQVTWDPAHGIKNTIGTSFNSTGIVWNYIVPLGVVALTPSPGATLAAVTEVQATFTDPVLGVNAEDLLINGAPATSVFGSGVGPYIFQFPLPPTGTVQLAWAPAHGITDGSGNPFVGGSWSVTLDPASFTGDVIINEFLAGNNFTNSPLDLDEDNEIQDWIEIYNRGTNSVRMLGWSLTHDREIPGLWTFPDVTLAAGKFLLVYASEKNRTVVGGLNALGKTNQLHTNFKLGLFGDYLALLSADSPRRLIQDFNPEYPEQRNDYSHGLTASNGWRYYALPTPLASNGISAITQVVPKPHVNAARGLYDAPFALVANCDFPGATMRYTTDGTGPSETVGTIYSGPMVISNTAIFRIIAYQTNMLPSQIATYSYIFLNGVLAQPTNPPGYPPIWWPVGSKGGASIQFPADYEMDPEIITNAAYTSAMKPALTALPVLSLSLKPSDLFDSTSGIYVNSDPGVADRYKWERAASAEFIVAAGEPGFQIDCGVRMQGNASRDAGKQSKHPMRLMFKGDYGQGRLNYSVFPDSPVDSYNTIVLRSDFNDSWTHWDPVQRVRGTRMRDAFGKDCFRAMGQPAAHSRYIHLYLNGLYWGIYDFSERADSDFAASYYGGDASEFDSIVSKPTEAIDGDINAYNAMTSFIKGSNMTQLANYVAATRLVDMTNFVDYMLLNFWAANADWGYDGNWNAVHRRSAGGLFEYLVWDAERYIEGTNDNRTTANGDLPSGLHTNLIYNSEYRLLFADRVYKHCFNGGALTTNQTVPRWLARAAQLDSAIVAESARWGDNRRDVTTTNGGGTAPYYLYTKNDFWTSNVNWTATNYFPLRLPPFLAQLRTTNLFPNVTAPVFNQHGGRVAPGFALTMSGATNPIYFTTNGLDPRVFGSNTIASSAQAYTGAITLNASMNVKARALFNGTNWSPLLDANFTVGVLGLSLRVTEIMYNPSGGDVYEYIEMQNVGGTPLNLGLHSFVGISFTFPVGYTLAPGQRIVLGNNAITNAWKVRYPGVNVTGWFGGNLSNGGEKLSVLDPLGNVVLSVSYDDENGWDVVADGNGHSLEIINPNGNPDDPANWRASNNQNGTPGSINSAPPIPTVFINEVMAENLTAVNNGGTYPDWIELYNSGASATNIAGWSVTDDGTVKKFVFPANTIIPAGGYLVVWCDTNATPGLHTGFALGRKGDSLFLYDASSTRIDAISFGPQIADYSIGRVGGVWTLATPTTNAPNIAAALAPASSLAINEWLANPVPGSDDWVELFNSSGSAPVALQNLHLGNSNVTFQIRSLSFIAPGGFLQLIADENFGFDHLNFKLPSTPNAIVLYDNSGGELQRVTYGAQIEGVTQGRYPDGSANIVSFPASASPGASNYLNNYAGPALNEVLARNSNTYVPWGSTPDFIEIFNSNAAPASMGGMGLSDEAGSIKFRFAPATTIGANGFLVVWCDDAHAEQTNGPVFNASFAINGDSGAVYLFNTNGQAVNGVDYGFQITDMPIGLAGGQWQLLSNATPGAANAPIATLGSVTNLVVNEWMANPVSGDDWFELYNRDPLPVNIVGVYLTDDPSLAGLSNTVAAPLSFVAAGGWVKFAADGHRGKGHDHVGFNLDAGGEVIRLYTPAFGIIDSVSFGAQALGVSQGRLPDGATSNLVSFPTTPTPDAANYLPHASIVVSEVLTHTDLPFEDAIELQNVGSNLVAIAGWWISNSENPLRKFQVPANASTTLAPGQFVVFYENQLNPDATGNAPSFTLNSARGDTVYVSETDTNGNFTGYRAQVSFGAAENPVAGGPVSFGRFATSVGYDFTALAQRTFGADSPVDVAQFRSGVGLSNSYAKVGPVVFNEVNYHPVTIVGNNLSESSGEEFVELHNMTGSAVPLYDPAHPANTWRIDGGISFKFNAPQFIPARGYMVIVGFDPLTNAAALANFRARYGSNGAVFGPFKGQLSNGGDVVELYKPDAPQAAPHPDAGYVPQILADRVAYSDTAPWPTAADGGGASLQRIAPGLYGNDPANWKAEPASVGATNSHVGDIAPTVTSQPTNFTVVAGGTATFQVGVAGTGPFSYQWQRGTNNLPGAVDPTLVLSNVQGAQAGTYRVVVTNLAGPIISADATLTVLVPPSITAQPTNTVAIAGNSAQFNVTATGTSPISYQWRKNNVDINGANSAQYFIPNVQPTDATTYSVVLSNVAGVVISSAASLTVIVPTSITGNPVDVIVTVNTQATFTVAATGTAPLAYQWRKDNVNIPGATSATYVIPSAQVTNEGFYSVVVSNAGGSVPSSAARLTVVVAPVLGVPHLLSDGAATFILQGQSNRSYFLDLSPNLTAWSNFATVTLTSNSLPVTDPTSTNVPMRFYRARPVP